MNILSNKGSFPITKETKIFAEEGLIVVQQFIKIFKMKYGFAPIITNDSGADIILKKGPCKEEGFIIDSTKEKIVITYGDKRGAIYGLQHLIRLCKAEGDSIFVESTYIEDSPYKKIRGVHLLPPAPNRIEDFKRVIDALCFLKYNLVIIEICGTMEFESHPEVNRAWVMFCDLMQNKFPGGPQNLQWSDRYWKNSTHTSVADGKLLTKAQFKEIVDYAKNLGMDVIPEIQALSHCYHLTLAHPDIAEDKNDIFPDTYCPLNEKSYELYFDIANEVIEVFEPDMVSIGHDEIRIMCECPDCKGRTGHDLLAYEINRLYDFYNKKGIKVTMWAEKLLSPEQFLPKKLGGGRIEKSDDYGRHWVMPATYKALKKLPRDILMIDWYYMLSTTTEQEFVAEDFKVIFGNFKGSLFGNWEVRSKNVLGAEVSTWCKTDEPSLARAGMLIELIFSGEILWHEDFNNSMHAEYMDRVLRLVNDIRTIIRAKAPISLNNCKLLYKGEGEMKITAQNAKTFNHDAQSLIEKSGDLCGTSIDMNNIMLKPSVYAEELVFINAFKKREEYYNTYFSLPGYINMPFTSASNRVNLPRWTPATFTVLYDDNTIELANMTYGICGADINMKWDRQSLTDSDDLAEIDILTDESHCNDKSTPNFKLSDEWLYSTVYYSEPIIAGDKTVYIHRWTNPYPDKKIVKIKAINTGHDKEQSLLLFALGYIPQDEKSNKNNL